MDDPQAVELDRIRRSAFNITSTFEGSKSYANYQNYDAGAISYGRFQFTLAQGALVKVVNYYLAASTSDTANQMRAYQARIQARDTTLRTDQTLQALLVAAAAEPAMQAAQDRVVMESYWVPARDSITSRGILTPLGHALIFDMAVEHGPANKLIQTAESKLGAPPKSMLGQNGLNEQQLITQLAQVRHDYLYNFADQNGLPGVKKRADFWVALVGQADWQLQGDADGNVFVYSRPVQVRNPPGASLTDPTYKLDVRTASPAPPSPAPAPPPAPTTAASPAPTATAPAAEAGQPVSGTYVTNQTLAVYETPSTNSVLMGRVEQGRQLAVTRHYTPSPGEEWLLTDVGWVANRLPSIPGQVFGDLTLS
jgi:hypothetical protein